MKLLSLIISFLLLVSACSDSEPPISAERAVQIDTLFSNAKFSNAKASPAVMEKWSRSCALCHVEGQGGAPMMSDKANWQARLGKGHARLLIHTLEGFNRMPPLGYCMDCTEADFAAMIQLMSGSNQ